MVSRIPSMGDRPDWFTAEGAGPSSRLLHADVGLLMWQTSVRDPCERPFTGDALAMEWRGWVEERGSSLLLGHLLAVGLPPGSKVVS